MRYKGKLYGRLGDKYFELDNTAEDFDALQQKVDELAEQVLKFNLDIVVGSEFTECVKTIVKLHKEKEVIVYVPQGLNATEWLDYYDRIFTNGWISWDKVN
jgi:prefoldin subunit 5